MPGLGQLVVQAASAHDIALVQGVALVFTIVIMLANLLIELAYAAVNPKVRA
jgi:peptide/nickel transport system permease protein